MSAKSLTWVLAIGLLAGCSAQSIESAPSVTPTEAQTESKSLPTESETIGPVACETDLQTAIELTINSQTAAFAADDFELAYSYSSPYFQATVTVDQFVQIINNSYGPLISSSNLVFSNCLTDSSEKLGVIDVRFLQQTNEVFGLKYLMVNTSGGWKVQAASNLGVVGEGA